VIVKCCTGHRRVFQGLHWSEQWALHPQIRMRCCLQRQRLNQWHFPLGSSQAVEMIDNYGTQCMSVQLVAAVYYKSKMLSLWNVPMGIAGYVQVCIRCCVQRQRLDQWHCCSQAVEMIDNYGTQLLGPGVRGRHRDIWRRLVHMELTALGVVYKWHKLAKDRLAWRKLIASVRT